MLPNRLNHDTMRLGGLSSKEYSGFWPLIPYKNGAAYEARTRYLHLGKVALYRMSYVRKDPAYHAGVVPPVGVEPTTRGFSVRCSTY